MVASVALTSPVDAAELTAGGLPLDVVPTHYAVSLELDPASLEFQGKVTIDLEVKEPTPQIVMNAKLLEVSRAVLAGVDEVPAEVTADAKAETLRLRFARPIAAGPARIVIDYKGTVNEASAGLFVATYETAAGAPRRMLATQFEAADARRVFPCWDEPALKASFDLALTVPSQLVAVSNMPILRTEAADVGRSRVTFATTPKMSTYLLFAAVGELDTLGGEVDGTRINIVAKRGDAEKGRFALEAAKDLLRFYNDYFGVPYPLPKLDLIAVPGAGGFSAMENWGAILYFEPVLLLDPAASSEVDRQRVFVVVAHEMAHQWFGDLVTMRWWDNLWLNEAFASWMENKATDAFHPEWQIWLQAKGPRDQAMRTDALPATHPIVQPIASPAEADQAFDEITYQKGQGVIRMIEAYLGADPFRDGIRRYMRAHAYGNTASSDLWAELEAASGRPVEPVAVTFTTLPGVPLVEVEPGPCDAAQRELSLALGRFAYLDPDLPPNSWRLPVGLATLEGSAPLRRELLLQGPATVAIGRCDDGSAVTANAAGIGYYRVAYAPELMRALRERFRRLDPADQLTRLPDSFALGEAGRAPVADYLDLTQELAPDADYAVWRQVLDAITELDELARGLPARAPFREYARRLLRPLADRLGWEAKAGEPANDGILRQRVLTLLGLVEDRATIEQARRRWEAASSDLAGLDAAIKPIVLRMTAATADEATYLRLREAGRQTNASLQKRQIYEALAYARDPQLAQRTLDLALTDELPPQLRPALLRGVATAGQLAELAWPFLVAHYDALAASLDSMERYRLPATIAQNFVTGQAAAELRRFADQHIPADARANVEKAAALIEFRSRVREERFGEVQSWLAAHASAPAAPDQQAR